MSNFKFGKRSIDNLYEVHPDLVAVVHRALKLSTIDFTVIEGLRTLERQKQLVAQGVSKTMNSYHLKGKAVDLYPYYDGKVQVNAPVSKFDAIAKAMNEAANELGVTITCGKDWKTLVDRPHYQIEI